jgi:hypothetical protein
MEVKRYKIFLQLRSDKFISSAFMRKTIEATSLIEAVSEYTGEPDLVKLKERMTSQSGDDYQASFNIQTASGTNAVLYARNLDHEWED